MQAIQMDQGLSSVLNFVRGFQPENTPDTLCDTCGVDSDRIVSYEVTTAAEADFRNGNLDKLGVQSPGSVAPWGSTCTIEPIYGMTSKCTPSFEKGKSLIVSH